MDLLVRMLDIRKFAKNNSGEHSNNTKTLVAMAILQTYIVTIIVKPKSKSRV